MAMAAHRGTHLLTGRMEIAEKTAPAVHVHRSERATGAALEVLTHAIEYLVDSRMFLSGVPYTKSESDALKILSTSSREIFQGSPDVEPPLRMRLSGWLRERLHTC